MRLQPFYADVQAHYDLSNEFYGLFLDPSMTYSCAYFEQPDYSLAQAQQAKIDLSLGKCQIQPGMKLLDIGCGWGATARRAAEHDGAHVVGLTLSRAQYDYSHHADRQRDNIDIRMQGWEEFEEPVDRIVSIGAFEHFRMERYAAFFERCFQILPSDGRMLLHSIVHGDAASLRPGLDRLSEDFIDYMRFISKHIFPGGQVPPREMIILHAQQAGFQVERVHPLGPHYHRTLTCWAENLKRNREIAIRLTNEEVVERYLRYLWQSAEHFDTGRIDIAQFTLVK